MLSKEELITSIVSTENGKWFQYTNRYGQLSLVKMKKTILDIDGIIEVFIESMWLSVDDPETMAFESYELNDFDIINGQLVIHSADVYHFGSPDASDENSIYDDERGLIDEKVKHAVLSYADKDFITQDEFDNVWSDLKNKRFDKDKYEVLAVNAA